MKELLDSGLIELSVGIPGFTGKILHSSTSSQVFSRLHFFSVKNENVPRLCRMGIYQNMSVVLGFICLGKSLRR